MIPILLNIALISIPLILGFLFHPLMPYAIDNARDIKIMLALCFALSIGLTQIYTNGLQPFRFKWVLILLGYMLFNFFISPEFNLNLFNTDIGKFWFWRPMTETLIYFLYLLAIKDCVINFAQIERIFKIITWLAIGSALYIFIQKLGFDQFQELTTDPNVRFTASNTLTATFTHPNFAAIFLAMCLPFLFYLCEESVNYIYGVTIVLIAILLCNSLLGYLTAFISTIFFCHFIRRRIFLLGIFLALLGCFCFIKNGGTMKTFTSDNGRFNTWQDMKTELIHPSLKPEKTFVLTGYSLGAYKYLFTALKQSPFQEAHNELFEFTWNTGLIGGILLIFSIFSLIFYIYPFTISDIRVLALTASFISILAASMGTFVFQIEPIRFYAVTILGLILNLTRRGK